MQLDTMALWPHVCVLGLFVVNNINVRFLDVTHNEKVP